MRRLIAGIDAGGTGVRLRVSDADSGALLQDVEGPAARDLGPSTARALLADTRVAALCAGIAGYTRPEVRDAWRAAFADTPLRLEPDYAIALQGALSGRDGVLVLAGTGAVAFGQRAGASLRVGGRGWEYGDEGSGGFVTTELIRRTVRAADGLLPATPLTEALCLHLGSQEAGEIAAIARALVVAEGRGFLSPWIAGQAQAGQPEAKALFVGAAGWLGRLLWTTAERLGYAPADPMPIACAGGLWQVGDTLRRPFETVVWRRYPNAQIQSPDGPPVAGALRLALATLTAPT